MKTSYCLSFLFLFQCFTSCDHAVKLPQIAISIDSVQMQKKDNAVIANIIFKSINGGQTWQNISEGLPKPIADENTVDNNIFFADDNVLWLTAGNEIYHCNLHYKAPFWTKENFPDEHNSIAPGKAGIFAYNNWGSGVFQKANKTGAWLPVYTNFKEKQVHRIFETASGIIFISSDRGFFKSTNNGKSWKQLPDGGWGKMAELNGILLATSQRGILRSTDDGEHWALVINEGGVGIDVERIEGGFAAITYSTVSKTRRIRTSYDGGQTWQAIDAGLLAPDFIEKILPPINAKLPVHGFSDSARHPKDSTTNPLPMYITTIIQVGENFFCGRSDGIYKTSNKGKTWQCVRCVEQGMMFKLYVVGNVIYAIQMKSHC